MKKGLFIVIEGEDGSGKSTHAGLLAEYLKSKGREVLVTEEPTRGFIGREIRSILADRKRVSPATLGLLFTADRAEHVEKVIKPALAEGKVVISDRYYYSTIAYQSTQGVDQQWISQMNSFAAEPDLVILLEVPTEVALSRIGARQKEVFEYLEFQKKVQQKLIELAKGGHKKLSRPGKKWAIVSTAGETQDVQKKIRAAADACLD